MQSGHSFSSKFSVASFLALTFLSYSIPNVAQASCGAASCFLNVGNQPSVQPQGTLRTDMSYSYVPQKGPQNRVAAVNLKTKEQILDEHQEISTISQQLQMNLNYGVTDHFTLQLSVPVIFRDHDHRVEVGIEPDSGHHEGEGEFENFDTSGIGDIRLMAKYGFLPSLRSLLVFGAGVEFPTGQFEAQTGGHGAGVVEEPSLQVGRGDYGVIGHVYQAYELIPHSLNQFLSYTYRHTFQNKFGYQFGDTHIVSGGLIYNITSRFALSGQFNYIYNVGDTLRSTLSQAGGIGTGLSGETDIDTNLRRRSVSNTGSTNLLFTPGLTLNFNDSTSWYFYAQVPLVQDFNGGLEQGVSFLTGFVKFFNVNDAG
ncbi:MAG: hypothetical protein OEZ41_07265 [Nitrospirota bacterium]|nr:hypothetical protein [Nitrospirota bacterium]MDH5699741.1 hypothetical protein [Nitrospirota bacterium]